LSMLPSTEAEVSLQGNMMVISASKDGKVMTISDGVGSADIIENVMSDEEMENLSKKFDGGNKIDKQTTQMWMKAISVMGSGKTKIEVKDKKLSMVNPNDLKEEASLTIDFDYKDVSTAMNAEVLSGILNALKDEEINVSIMRTNAPIQFKVSNEQMIVRIIQAPIVGDDEEEKAKEEKKGADKDE